MAFREEEPPFLDDEPRFLDDEQLFLDAEQPSRPRNNGYLNLTSAARYINSMDGRSFFEASTLRSQRGQLTWCPAAFPESAPGTRSFANDSRISSFGLG